MSEKTRIRRLPERAVEDKETIYSILDEGLVCHVAYITEYFACRRKSHPA